MKRLTLKCVPLCMMACFVCGQLFATPIPLKKKKVATIPTAPPIVIRSPQFVPFVADLTDDVFAVEFLRTMGMVTVSVTDETETVYTALTVDTDTETGITLHVSFLPAGTYLLQITLENGTVYEGEFEMLFHD